MESSRRDLSNDMAEHRPILKNIQNTYYSRFSFTSKTGIEFPKTRVLFLLRAPIALFDFAVRVLGYLAVNLMGIRHVHDGIRR